MSESLDDDDGEVVPERPAVAALYKQLLDRKQQRTVGFQEAATAALMKALRMPAPLRRAVYADAATYGRSLPWLENLIEAVPNLPIYPVADLQPNLRDNAGLACIFPVKRFNKLPFVKRYLELWEATRGERVGKPLVWIIKWPNVPGGVCVHTMADDGTIDGIRLGYRVTTEEGNTFTMIVEPLAQLLPLLNSWGWES